MRPLLMFIAALFIASLSFAAFPVASPTESKVAEPKEQQVSVKDEDAINMSAKDYERLTGKKMNIIERFVFKIKKKQIVDELRRPDGATKFNIAGFALGLLLGPYGILIALFATKNKSFKKSFWLGFSVWVLVFLVIMLVIFGKAMKK